MICSVKQKDKRHLIGSIKFDFTNIASNISASLFSFTINKILHESKMEKWNIQYNWSASLEEFTNIICTRHTHMISYININILNTIIHAMWKGTELYLWCLSLHLCNFSESIAHLQYYQAFRNIMLFTFLVFDSFSEFPIILHVI